MGTVARPSSGGPKRDPSWLQVRILLSTEYTATPFCTGHEIDVIEPTIVPDTRRNFETRSKDVATERGKHRGAS